MISFSLQHKISAGVWCWIHAAAPKPKMFWSCQHPHSRLGLFTLAPEPELFFLFFLINDDVHQLQSRYRPQRIILDIGQRSDRLRAVARFHTALLSLLQ